MMYKSNIGLIYKNKIIYLFIKKETIKKIIYKISIIKKINLLKKIIILKNTKKLNLKKVSDRDYETIQCICKIYNIKKAFKKSWEAVIVDMPFKNWENKIKTFKIKENSFKMFKNTITINYRKEYAFLIYMFINETIEGSEYNEQKTTVIIDEKVVKWEKEKISKIIKKLIRSEKCILSSNRDFLYYIEMELDNTECMYEVKSQTV
jgi:hypothetical protein